MHKANLFLGWSCAPCRVETCTVQPRHLVYVVVCSKAYKVCSGVYQGIEGCSGVY